MSRLRSTVRILRAENLRQIVTNPDSTCIAGTGREPLEKVVEDMRRISVRYCTLTVTPACVVLPPTVITIASLPAGAVAGIVIFTCMTP